jgi:transglutaminase-like putative cysteine protease
MKRIKIAIISIFLLLCTSPGYGASSASTLYRKAQELERRTYYEKAANYYLQARDLFIQQKDERRATACLAAFQQMKKIILDYPYPEAKARKLLLEAFPGLPISTVDSWFREKKLESLLVDGKPHYFQDLVKNIYFRNLNLAQQNQKLLDRYRIYFARLSEIINHPADVPGWRVYINPKSFQIKSSITIPRNKFPATGQLRVWVPLPIVTGPQTDIWVISIRPSECVPLPPKIDADLGLVYLEIPLDRLKNDLAIALQYSLTHYEQRCLVNPDQVGTYDKNSDLYRTYTKSHGDIVITGAIRKKAKEIIEGTRNPYLAGQKIYNYVVNQIKYSHMPHISLGARRIPESIYVHNHGFGDCGAQSAYFSALCRAVGIPARTTGGWQLIPGVEGPHFWAEFYLPNYGWLPVDTSIAQIAQYLPELTPEQRHRFQNYFFGKMDPFRLVIQKDVDIPLTPPPSFAPLVPMALQVPEAQCDTMNEIPSLLFMDGWKVEVRPPKSSGGEK